MNLIWDSPIIEGRERVAKKGVQKGDEKEGPDPLQSNNEQDSWWQGLVAAISNPFQSVDPGLDYKRGQEKEGLGSQIEEPKPTAKNIKMPPEKDQAKFTWKGLWSKVSNAVTSVFMAEETASQADSLSEKSSSNSASDPKTEKELPEDSPSKSVAQESSNTSIVSKIRNGLASLLRKGAEQNKEGLSTGLKTPEKEGVVFSTKPPTPTIEQKKVRFGTVDARMVQNYLGDKSEFKKVKTTPADGRSSKWVLKAREENLVERSRGG